MKKSAIVLFLTALLTSATLFAQSIQEGINNLYAERYESAKNVFNKMLASNPNNIEATYWLGQTYIDMDDTAGARSLYQKALASNGNAPLMLVGMGHIELLEGKTAEARQHFDAAIMASKGRKGNDPNVLNAIGRANVDAKAGDLAYAIQKLTEAAQLAPNNPDILLNLGNAYRKAHEGGNAVTNYIKATQINPNFAPAYYRMAKLYETQHNWDIFTQDLNKAVQVDPRFAPAYYSLYYYTLLYPKDFAKAQEYADKFVSSSDPSVQNDYVKAQTYYMQKNYDQAINIGKNIIATAGAQTRPIVYRMMAYSNLDKGDTATACQYVGQFFQKAKEEDITGLDYILQADACGKGDPNIVMESYRKAAQMDTVLSSQINTLNEGIRHLQQSGNRLGEADLRLLSYQLRGKDVQPAELIAIGIPYYYGGNFQRADSLFKAYEAAAPDSIYGYLWSSRALAQQDTTMQQGLAVPDYEQLLRVAQTDKERYKAYGVQAAGYLAGYYNNIKNDKATAISYLEKGLEFDPTNASLISSRDVLKRSAERPATPTKEKTKPSGKTKTKTRG